jgi:hypothetical protein
MLEQAEKIDSRAFVTAKVSQKEFNMIAKVNVLMLS